MKIKVKERVAASDVAFVNYVGLEPLRVVAVNPTRAELNALYGKENSDEDKEIEYVSETESGVDKIRISVYIKGLMSDKLYSKSFFLEDEGRMNKDNTKYQYVNQVCQTAWSDIEDNLPGWFTKFTNKDKKVVGDKSFRIAKKGEGDFYEFVRIALNKIDYYDLETQIEFNWKKMLKGNFDELNQFLTSEDFSDPFVMMSYIKDVPTEEGVVQYNELFTKSAISLTMYNEFVKATSKYYNEALEEIKEDDELISKYGLENIEELTLSDIYGYVNTPLIRFKSEYSNKTFTRFLESLEGEYGCNGFYKVAPVFKYNVNMSITSSNKSISQDGDDY
jgi:hypothetical protein